MQSSVVFRKCLLMLIIASVSACSLINPNQNKANDTANANLQNKHNIDNSESTYVPKSTSHQLGRYYVWIKSLTKEQLAQEIAYQKQAHLVGSFDTEIKLLIIQSLPSSPIYSPYNAKAKLNNKEVFTELQDNDLAIITLLKDQLNQQLLLLDKIAFMNQKQEILKNENINKQKTISSLENKLAQLKIIEKAINKHGQ